MGPFGCWVFNAYCVFRLESSLFYSLVFLVFIALWRCLVSSLRSLDLGTDLSCNLLSPCRFGLASWVIIELL